LAESSTVFETLAFTARKRLVS